MQLEQIQVAQIIQALNPSPKIAWLPIDYLCPEFNQEHYDQIKSFAFTQFNYSISEFDLSLDPDFAQTFTLLKSCFEHIQNAEAYAVHQPQLITSAHLYQTEVLERLTQAKNSAGWQYVQALQQRDKLQAKFDDFFKVYDFLILPTLPIPAPNLFQRYLYISQHQINIKSALLSLTSPWNLLGLPSCSLPIGLFQDLPIGIQVVAKQSDDFKLLDFIQRF